MYSGKYCQPISRVPQVVENGAKNSNFSPVSLPFCGLHHCSPVSPLLAQLPATVEPRFNEVPRDRGKWFIILTVRYIEVLFHILHYYWAKKYRLLCQGLCYNYRLRFVKLRFHHLNARNRQKCGTCGIRVAFGSILSLMWYQVILKIS